VAQAPKCKACGKVHWSNQPCDGQIAKAAIGALRGRPTPAGPASPATPTVEGQVMTLTDDPKLKAIIDGLESRISTLEAALKAITERIDTPLPPIITAKPMPLPDDEAKKAKRREAARLAMSRKRAKDSSSPT
jgi:hypothetical protein